MRKIFENHPFDQLRANINAVRRQDGAEPLLFAAIKSGRTDVVEYILEEMSENDVRSCRDDNGNSALHIAAIVKPSHLDGSRYIMQKLMEKEADKTAINKAGESVLEFAISWPVDVEGVRYLLDNGSLEQEHDWTKIVYELLDGLLDMYDDDWPVTTILLIIETIMERRFVDFYREIRDGESLAHYMASHHKQCNLTDIFDPFKKREINIIRRDKSGKTMLELAYPSILPHVIFEIDQRQCCGKTRRLFLLKGSRGYLDVAWAGGGSSARPFKFNNSPSMFPPAKDTTWYFIPSNNVCPNVGRRFCTNGNDRI